MAQRTWRDEHGATTLVTAYIEPAGASVTLVDTHKRLAAGEARRLLTYGWNGGRDRLKAVLEEGATS